VLGALTRSLLFRCGQREYCIKAIFGAHRGTSLAGCIEVAGNLLLGTDEIYVM